MITVASLFGWMTPGELGRFPLADRDRAVAWAAESRPVLRRADTRR
jgi:hypothetical protein